MIREAVVRFLGKLRTSVGNFPQKKGKKAFRKALYIAVGYQAVKSFFQGASQPISNDTLSEWLLPDDPVEIEESKFETTEPAKRKTEALL